MENPSQTHFGAAKRILRYIAGTAEFGIWYSSKCSMTDNGKLYGYSDSDFGSCLDDRRSISAHVFSLGSGVVAWSSKKQPITALSSTEAEYVAVAFAACQAVWIRGILSELQEQSKAPTIIFCDNKSTIFMTKNAALHSRTKHIDTRMHFIRDLVTGKVVDIQYCSTHDQLADVLTKALPKDKFIRFRTLLGVCNYESRGSVESDSHHLEHFIDGSQPIPPREIAAIDGKLTPNHAFSTWFQRDQTLFSWINATLSESTVPYIVGKETAKDAWESLEHRYGSLFLAHMSLSSKNVCSM
ncbi:hypothetical protein MRB53_006570 [Persea americana]|uniref:Uncharacterized protein n=1 Tax=Persea americana TaxID=3435 RepID=A0ACC2MI60_PERAE|nr:hypothetical protein MRB53_006570 [Persea americana]